MTFSPAGAIRQARKAGTVKQPSSVIWLDGQEVFYLWVLKLKMDEGRGSKKHQHPLWCG